MAAPKIDIYTKFACPFCVRAKRLLTEKGAVFNEYDITMGGPKREEMLARAPHAMTVPQIFIGETHVAGATISPRSSAPASSTRCWPDRAGGLMPKIAVLQMCSGIAPARNFDTIRDAAYAAREGGAEMLFTPEMSLLLDRYRTRAAPHIVPQGESPHVAMLGKVAQACGLTIALGSMAVAVPGGRSANRSMLFPPSGGLRDLRQDPHVRCRPRFRRELAREPCL